MSLTESKRTQPSLKEKTTTNKDLILSSSKAEKNITVSMASENDNDSSKNKPSLRREELEEIAKQLKKKLSKASIAAKQSISPLSKDQTDAIYKVEKSSPLNHHPKRRLFASPTNFSGKILSSSSLGDMYSPHEISPTQVKSPAGVFLNSSPLKNIAIDSDVDKLPDSPSRKNVSVKRESKGEPHMILEQVPYPSTPKKNPAILMPSSSSKSALLDHSLNQQTTPTLQKKQLYGNSSTTSLLKTPTQSRPNTGGSYNDDEGADLLMYLATSPSPAKPFYSNTPRSSHHQHHNSSSSSVPNSAGSLSVSGKPHSPSSQNSFTAPPPLTPKHNLSNSARTPQNRVTPSVNLLNALNATTANGLPSSGLSLTPAGFNMSDYVNFFTPSPGSANVHNSNNLSAHSKAFLKTPDFNNIVSSSMQKQRVDGKMINFDKVLFGNSSSNGESYSKE
ncbi:uncharacterized protein PRCAT00000147001 [Priceomyces carsonii]|uniref:uncharacterized protein n=1 Tax=Priceomyces carsonii TaxID=28549 RepID=UPI002ED8DBB1|nr:unnamed protein product [Priceomyces carsonii]